MSDLLNDTCIGEGVGLAKLTLTLRVLDKRDDGYNNIKALTAFVDRITEKLKIYGANIDSPSLRVISGEKNLDVGESNLINIAIEKYNEALFTEKHIDPKSIRCELSKTIPIAAGLGGGSVDAALTLRVLNEIYDNTLSSEQLNSIAIDIGSDVSACLYSKLCWMAGRGETVTPVKDVNLGELAALIITPPMRCSTPAVYHHYDKIGRPSDVGLDVPQELLRLCSNIHNDLSLGAYDLYPELISYKKEIESITGRHFALAGSGSTFFTLGNEHDLVDLLKAVKNKLPKNRIVNVGKLL